MTDPYDFEYPESVQMDESEATTKHIVVAVCLGIGAVVLIVGAVL